MDNQTPLEVANITISAVETLSWGLKIKDEKGLVYNIPQYKKGTQDLTKAFGEITMMSNNGMNSNVGVKFAVVPNNQGGTSRYVRMIGMPEDLKTSTMPTQTQTPTPVVKGETDWDKISWGKCKHAYLVEAYKVWLQKENGETTRKEIEAEAETWADMSMRDTRKNEVQNKVANADWSGEQPAQPTDMPVINVDEEPKEDEVNVDNIPF